MFSFSQMKSLAALVLCLFIMTSCASKKNDVMTKKANLYFGAGTQALIEAKYTEALKNLMKANELSPDNSEILNNLGMAYYFKAEKDLAIKTLKRSLEINKENSDARTNLASIYYHEKNYDQAEKLYKQVLKDLTYDKQARTLYNLGMLEMEARKNLSAAENYFKKSVKEDENYCPSFHQLGIIDYTRKRYTSALENFKQATYGTCHQAPAPLYYQALTFIALKRYDEARLKLDEIDTRFKKNIYAVKARAKMLELSEIEKQKGYESHASRNVLESPEF